MLKNRARWSPPLPPSIFPKPNTPHPPTALTSSTLQPLKLPTCCFFTSNKDRNFGCRARRRVRFEDEEEDELNDYNPDIALLELYSQSVKQEALIVRATVDEVEEEILIFKGFSSSLSYGTSPDPSKSILPAGAVVNSIDRVKGPFDPTGIEYIEKGLTMDDFKARLRPS